MTTCRLPEATLMWDSDTENPSILSSSTVCQMTPQHINSSPCLVRAPGLALPLLIRLCLVRRPHLPFLVLQSPQTSGPFISFFLMRAMIALVSVVGPSLAEEKPVVVAKQHLKGLDWFLILDDLHLYTSPCVFYGYLMMTLENFVFGMHWPALSKRIIREFIWAQKEGRWYSSVYLHEYTDSFCKDTEKVCSLLSPMVKNHHPLPHRLMGRESLQDPMTQRSYMEEGGGKKHLARPI